MGRPVDARRQGKVRASGRQPFCTVQRPHTHGRSDYRMNNLTTVNTVKCCTNDCN